MIYRPRRVHTAVHVQARDSGTVQCSLASCHVAQELRGGARAPLRVRAREQGRRQCDKRLGVP